MKQPRMHAALIKKWADGAEIQYLDPTDRWKDVAGNNPMWALNTNYRVKPEEVLRCRIAIMRRPENTLYPLAVTTEAASLKVERHQEFGWWHSTWISVESNEDES